MLPREAEINAKLQQIVSRKFDVPRIRTHGDFHLGQVLSTGDDFILIDFEGEPARPLSERRYKRWPAPGRGRDAALVRLRRRLGAPGRSPPAGGRRRPRRGPTPGWRGSPRATSRDTWRRSRAQATAEPRTDETAPYVPASDADTVLLIDFYMLEKCIYEVGYELNNRPDWLDIPLRGLERLITPRA